MGDFKVHRFRIGDWMPVPIRSISSDPFSDVVSIGREDGDIELLDASNKYHCLARVPGMKDFKLQSLLWSQKKEEEGRLFGISLRGFLFEVDLSTLLLTNIQDTFGGNAWSLAASPRDTVLAVGCEDSSVRLFRYHSTSGKKKLEYSKSLNTSGARVLSLAYHPSDPLLFVGSSDAVIRCIDENSGLARFRMTGDVSGGATASIWSLVVLADSTVVSGSSAGRVQFWDGVNGVLLESYHQHSADVLSLCVSRDEQHLFASGVDGKVVYLRKLVSPAAGINTSQDKSGEGVGEGFGSERGESGWVYVQSHRAHTHDVFSLCLVEPRNSRSLGHPSCLLSGGMDCKLCCYSVESFAQCRPKWIGAVPSGPRLLGSDDAHSTLVMKHRSHLDIWRTGVPPPEKQAVATGKGSEKKEKNNSSSKRHKNSKDQTEEEEASEGELIRPMLQLQCRVEVAVGQSCHLHSVALSDCGSFLGTSSAAGLRLWKVKRLDAGKKRKDPELLLERVEVEGDLSSGRRFTQALTFSSKDHDISAVVGGKKEKKPEGFLRQQLVALYCCRESLNPARSDASDSEVRVYSICPDSGVLRPEVTFSHSDVMSGEMSSQEGRELNAEGRNAVGCGERLSFGVRSLGFSRDKSLLVVVTNSGVMYVYDLLSRKVVWRPSRFSSPVTHALIHHFPSYTETNTLAQKPKAPARPSLLPSKGLVVLLADNSFMVLDLETQKPSLWSQEPNNTPSTQPDLVRHSPGALTQICVSPTDPNHLVLVGAGMVVFVDLAPSPPSSSAAGSRAEGCGLKSSNMSGQQQYVSSVSCLSGEEHVRCVFSEWVGSTAAVQFYQRLGKKRKRKVQFQMKEGENEIEKGKDIKPTYTVIKLYQNLIHFALMPNKQMVVVENPWSRIAALLPDTLARKRYGT